MGKTINFKDTYPSAITLFSKWAEIGKDEGMEKGHAKSVNFMFDKLKPFLQTPFSVLDVGCGNGWVVRKFKEIETCERSLGIDGAEKMILKAQSLDSENQYVCADILQWSPPQQFNIIHSMEVLYYLKNPSEFINTIYSNWLNQKGCFIFGIDHYSENPVSISWPEDVGVNMNTQSIGYWVSLMEDAGFRNVNYWQTGAKKDWMGTLVVFGEK